MSSSGPMMTELFAEVLRDGHRYVPDRAQHRPTVGRDEASSARKTLERARELGRDAVERAASRAGFSHSHFDPELAAQRLARVVELREGLEDAYARLADDHSRRTMLDVLKLRVLSPHHVSLSLTPQEFRAKQLHVERTLQVEPETFPVSDPWFSPLSLYRIPLEDGSSITMHGHSVDIVSVFLLGQYTYARGADSVSVDQGDVVLDIGGCWGDTALYFAHLVGPAGRVYTFEFDPESLAVLRANLELNPRLAERIEIVERAVWERSDEELEFRQAGRCTTLVEGDNDGSMPVQTVTIDDFVSRTGIEELSFVKVDVEGAEVSVLRGAQGTLEALTPTLALAAYHHDDDLITLPNTISESSDGWRFYLDSFSAVEEETVLFAHATRRRNST
jgi:FkbM family methyltransferase